MQSGTATELTPVEVPYIYAPGDPDDGGVEAEALVSEDIEHAELTDMLLLHSRVRHRWPSVQQGDSVLYKTFGSAPSSSPGEPDVLNPLYTI